MPDADYSLRGPLIFCLLLSLLLSMTASSEQKTIVFSGVFALIWIGEAVVTAQIKLLGGNMCDPLLSHSMTVADNVQIILPVRLHYRLHPVPPCGGSATQRHPSSNDCANTSLHCSYCMVTGSRYQHLGRIRSCEESGWDCCIPFVRLLRWPGVLVLHKLEAGN